MKINYILSSLCLSLLTSQADEATSTQAKALTINNTEITDPAVLTSKVAKNQPFWILHSYKSKAGGW